MVQPRLKICGLRDPLQAAAVAALDVDAIGVIGVPGSPRHVAADQRAALFAAAHAARPECLTVLVVADPVDAQLEELVHGQGHRVLQLHGGESPGRCRALRALSGCQIWKALRIRSPEDLAAARRFEAVADALLLDAWVPGRLGGTGHAIPLEWLRDFRPNLPWWLAGGITPQRVGVLLDHLQPDGLDVSSGVETSPGVKDLSKVSALIKALKGP